MIRIDMQMPEGCSECRFETERGFCKAMPDNFCGYTNDKGRPEWCPLKEQEPKPVIQERQCEVEPNVWERKGFCPKCRQIVLWMVNRKYCGFCGQEVKWNE